MSGALNGAMAPPPPGPPMGAPPPMSPPPPGPPPPGALGQAQQGPQAVIAAIKGAAAKLDMIEQQLKQIPGIDMATLDKGINAAKIGIQLIVTSLAHVAINSPQHTPAMMNQLRGMGGPPGGV